ncbi:MAG TPA: methyltransferase domain-containing protein [Candidatus Acidoferrales bacterium]|jgi:SAM-dependent methyltransferase|nr:methyltransferase domain-containing protein [Candidatus Acidoferrales bacterium]
MNERTVNEKAANTSKSDFWDSRYASGKTPWDFGGVPSALAAFLKRNRPSNVLIPGCGSGYEVQAFHEAGWDVVAIDFSSIAVEQARRYLGKLGSAVILGDFFRHDFGARRFNTIYERAFLCALPPDLWKACIDRMTQLLQPDGRLAGTYVYGVNSEPPPFPLTDSAAANELFGDKFKLLRSDSVEDSLPFFSGKERWQEWELK